MLSMSKLAHLALYSMYCPCGPNTNSMTGIWSQDQVSMIQEKCRVDCNSERELDMCAHMRSHSKSKEVVRAGVV